MVIQSWPSTLRRYDCLMSCHPSERPILNKSSPRCLGVKPSWVLVYEVTIMDARHTVTQANHKLERMPQEPKRKLILHIGTEKTGTTSIQNWLLLNREEIGARDVNPLVFDGGANLRALPAAFSAIDEYFLVDPEFEPGRHPENQIELRRRLQDFFDDEISKAYATSPKNAPIFVISSEHLSSRLRSSGQLRRLKGFLSTHFDDIQVVVYLRNQASMAESAWSTHLRSGGAEPLRIKPGAPGVKGTYFNHKKLLKLWMRTFGKKNIRVLSFDEVRSSENGVIDSFKQILVSAVGGANINTIDDLPIQNQALDYRASSMLWLYNLSVGGLYLESGGLNKRAEQIRQEFISSVSALDKGPGIRVDRFAWAHSFRASNEWVERRFPEVGRIFPSDPHFYEDLEARQRAEIDQEIGTYLLSNYPK